MNKKNSPSIGHNKKSLLNSPVEHIDIKSFDARKIIDGMGKMSFTSRDTARAASIYNEMLADKNCSIFLTLAGSTSAGGGYRDSDPPQTAAAGFGDGNGPHQSARSRGTATIAAPPVVHGDPAGNCCADPEIQSLPMAAGPAACPSDCKPARRDPTAARCPRPGIRSTEHSPPRASSPARCASES